MLWSYLLVLVGIFGLWLVGRKDRRGWMVGIFAQLLWIAYATGTHQWGFYIGALAYGFINIKNLMAWKPAKSDREKARLAIREFNRIKYPNHECWEPACTESDCTLDRRAIREADLNVAGY